MKYFWWIYIIVISLFQARALVKFTKIAKGGNGCVTEKGDQLLVGGYVRIPEVCGIISCETTEGDAAIIMCQKIHPYVFCECEAIDISREYPSCCYLCAKEVDC